MPRFLKQILEEEGISQAQLSRVSSVSTTTINKICTKNLNGSDISPTTKGKLTKAINKLVGNMTYKIQDIKFE
ncbi:MAG: helix-turn-helix transcriptional regulator [Chitinophagaceae bacterium]|nr:helix-turn-helix transcriptional regulator [Chitinophagaceae bacterium]